MVSDSKKKKAAMKASRSRGGSSKSLGSAGAEPDAAADLAARLASTTVGEDANDRSVTCVLTSHPQVRAGGGSACARGGARSGGRAAPDAGRHGWA